jgi:hypothetical protein
MRLATGRLRAVSVTESNAEIDAVAGIRRVNGDYRVGSHHPDRSQVRSARFVPDAG